MDKGSRIGNIISKKNGMFVSVDNNGNIREAGVGNPITECSFIAAPNSIVNTSNGTYYTPLSEYVNNIIKVIDPNPLIDIDTDKIEFNITNYNDNEISLNIINIQGNVKYSDIKWYVKKINDTDNIENIIEYNEHDNDLPCKLKYKEGYNNVVLYNKEYFDGTILVYAKAIINRLISEEVSKCSDYVLLQCDKDAKNEVALFYTAKTKLDENFNPVQTTSKPSPLSNPTLPPNCYFLSNTSYLPTSSCEGHIDLYTRAIYSYGNFTVTYNTNVNTVQLKTIINGIEKEIKSGDTILNHDITDVDYFYDDSNNSLSYKINDNYYKLSNKLITNKLTISYCSYTKFNQGDTLDSRFINTIEFKPVWGKDEPNNIGYCYIYGGKTIERPENENGLSITYNNDKLLNVNTHYKVYIPYETSESNPATINFTLVKDFGYNYDDNEYLYKRNKYPEHNVNDPNTTGWIIYMENSITDDSNSVDNYDISKYIINAKINDRDFKHHLFENNNEKYKYCYKFYYQQQYESDDIKVFESNNNKITLKINKIYNEEITTNNTAYIPVIIRFANDIGKRNLIEKIPSNPEICEEVKIHIYRNPTPEPLPTLPAVVT